MYRRFAGAALAVAAGGALLTATGGAAQAAAPSAPAQERGRQAPDFTGIVALSNCSGSLVRGPRTSTRDKALVLTNGHCLETGMPKPGQVIVDQKSTRAFKLLDRKGTSVLGELKAAKVAYSTMTDTDATVYQLDTTYGEIKAKYGISALKLAVSHPREGKDISIVSGYWKRIYTCKIDGFAHRVREAGWTWKDSIRYTPACDTIGGTSGSPVVDHQTGQVVGVHNTGNDNGEECTLNNPCEVDESGKITVRKGISYGQQTYLLARCLGRDNAIVLDAKCELPRPAR
ncbi:trypsin-like serine peptidase [Spirillospora sp. CA-294931]|uniref:trypsin-like serine peptidase n=1 Tax=Spirillospora sp. CA-294931 TaxID=3240042 RepID=UPI003D8A54A4